MRQNDAAELGTWPIGPPPNKKAKTLTDRLPRKVKHHFLECELKTANDLVREYAALVSEHTCEECDSDMDVVEEDTPQNRQKLIWLLERLQESVL